MNAEVAGNRRKLSKKTFRRSELLWPGRVRAEAIVGETTAIHRLEIGGGNPQLAAVDGCTSRHHATKAFDDIAIADRAKLRRFRVRIGIDLAKTGFHIHAERVGALPD